jgi:tryptophan-rich sensory protein
MHPLSVLVVLSPLVLSGLVASACPMTADAGRKVAARPPAWAFSVVWPLLFLGLGVALLRAGCRWPSAALVVLLAAWQATYSGRCLRNPRASTWLLVPIGACALAALGFAAVDGDRVSIAALSALTAWLAFAGALAVVELQVSQEA